MNHQIDTERLFVCGVTGDLHRIVDNRIEPQPIRSNYCQQHREIETVADLKAALRAGAFAWPGGYPLYFITADGGSLSFETVRKQFASVAWAIRNHEVRNGWRVIGCDVNWEDTELCDDHTGDAIPSAYGDK